jgi:hypothetical protein
MICYKFCVGACNCENMQETETQRLLHDETVRALERRWVEVKGTGI